MRYHYGQVIRMYRLQRGMSQSELAEHWPKADGTEGVNTRYVQDIEYGNKQISDPTILRKLASRLDIPLWSFGLSEYDPFHTISQPESKKLPGEDRAEKNPLVEQRIEEHAPHIPSVYYERMLRAYTQVEPSLFAWTMWNLGLLQLSTQIGLTKETAESIAIFKCSPPNPTVRSMYEIARHARRLPQTPKLRFYGQESLAGQAVMARQTISATYSCAVPIMRRNCISACLIVQSQFLLVPSIIETIQHYANLFSLAFSDSEFYPAHSIDLCTIPAETRQEFLLQEFDLQRLDLASLTMTNPDRIRRAEQLILRSVLIEKPGGVDVFTR